MHTNGAAIEAYDGQVSSSDTGETTRGTVDMADKSVNENVAFSTSRNSDVTKMGFPDISTEESECGSEIPVMTNAQAALMSPEARAACDALAAGDYDAVNKMAPSGENALNAAAQKEFAAQMKEKGMTVEYRQQKTGDQTSGAIIIGATGGKEAVRFKSTDTPDGKKVDIEAVTKTVDLKGNSNWVPHADQNQVLRLLAGIEKRAAK